MRRRALLTAALLGCLSLLATGCAASEAPARDGKIPIGVNGELTGPASLLGASYKNAVDVAKNLWDNEKIVAMVGPGTPLPRCRWRRRRSGARSRWCRWRPPARS